MLIILVYTKLASRKEHREAFKNTTFKLYAMKKVQNE